MKRILCLCMAIMLVMCSVPAAIAADEIKVTVNGRYVWFEDQQPIIDRGRTLVPMRAIFEALGYEVIWDDGMIDVYDKDENNIMTLWIDYDSMWTWNGNVTLDVAPTIINSRTLVPVRAISESIGANVRWDDRTRTVIITYLENSNNICYHYDTKEVVVNTNYEEYDDEEHEVESIIREVCEDCGDVVNTYSDLDYEDHIFRGDVCSKCGYEKEEECRHKNTSGVWQIDLERYEQNGSDETHDRLLRFDTVCNDCDETLNMEYRIYGEAVHDFVNNICEKCGYKKEIDDKASYDYVTWLDTMPVYEYITDKGISYNESVSNVRVKNVVYERGVLFEQRLPKRKDEQEITKTQYKIDGKYNMFSAKLVMGGGNNFGSSSLIIFGDGHELYRSPQLSEKTLPMDIDIDVSDVEVLEIEIKSKYIGGVDLGIYYSARRTIYLFDAKFQ